jgi:hypothetical protein
VTRASSISIRVRPPARPRNDGTAAWPELAWLAPGICSIRSTSLAGWTRWASSRVVTVAAPAGVDRVFGATPLTTWTDSIRPTGSTSRRQSVSLVALTVIVPNSAPARSKTTIWNGGVGSGSSRNSPSDEVKTEPERPTRLTWAPATGSPSPRTRTNGGASLEATARETPRAIVISSAGTGDFVQREIIGPILRRHCRSGAEHYRGEVAGGRKGPGSGARWMSGPGSA